MSVAQGNIDKVLSDRQGQVKSNKITLPVNLSVGNHEFCIRGEYIPGCSILIISNDVDERLLSLD